tara:strand:+ start:158 stop:1297 length:1140 start_codon:yes stop_codon:yes gene_type:complete
MNSLSGVLVVAIEQAVAAPLCTARLVDAGARVIKVEREQGDFARKYDSLVMGESSYFTWLNQGKESIVINFKNQDDRRLLMSIIKKADVFVQNLRPGALQKYSLDSESISKIHPDIVTCDISGYGEGEEEKKYKSYDLLVQAESGLVGISGSPKEYGRIGISICDIGAGITSYTAVLEGLIRKYRGFGGSSFKTSLFSVASEWMTVPLAQHEYGKKEIVAEGLRHPSIAPYGAFYSKDHKLILIAIQNEREWTIFCEKILKQKNMLKTNKFSSNNLRVTHRNELEKVIQKKFGELSFEYLKQQLSRNSIAFGMVNTLEDLSNHFAIKRQWVRTSFDQKVSFPEGPLKRNFTKGPSFQESLRSPFLGEHTQSIKKEFSES